MIFAEVSKDGRILDVTGAWSIALGEHRGKRVILTVEAWRANRSGDRIGTATGVTPPGP